MKSICLLSCIFLFLLYTHGQSKLSKELAEHFQPWNIRQVSFSIRNLGCFHSSGKELIFKPDSSRQWTTVPDKPQVIITKRISLDSLALHQFLRKLPAICDKKATIKDIGFTEGELELCRNDIGQLKKAQPPFTSFTFEKRSIDIERLLNVVNNIRNISDTLLHTALIEYSANNSTNSSTVDIKFTNYQGQELRLLHTHNSSASVRTPWYIATNSNGTQCSSLAVNQFILDACPGFLPFQNRQEMLQSIVKTVYLETDKSPYPL